MLDIGGSKSMGKIAGTMLLSETKQHKGKKQYNTSENWQKCCRFDTVISRNTDFQINKYHQCQKDFI